MKRTVTLIAASLAAAALVPGCSSSGSTKPAGAGKSSGITAGALSSRIDTALDALTSVHLDIDTGALGGTSTADLMLTDGNSTATDVHETESGMAVEVVTVGSTAYVRLPKAGNKPWVLVSPTSSNPIAKAIATSPGVTDALTSLSTVTGLVHSAQDITDKGNDATGHHYAMKILPNKVTGNPKLEGLLSILGSTPIPTDVWLDPQNRPVKVQLNIAFGGSQFPVTVLVSKFDAPLSITAPPRSEIAG